MAGKYYEELAVGTVLQHQPGRTVTEADNIWFSCLTMNPQTLHVDFHAAATERDVDGVGRRRTDDRVEADLTGHHAAVHADRVDVVERRRDDAELGMKQ